MLVISRTLAALAAATLALGSTAALAAPADAPAVERVAADTGSASELRGTTGWIIGAVALALIIWGAIELLDDDDAESP